MGGLWIGGFLPVKVPEGIVSYVVIVGPGRPSRRRRQAVRESPEAAGRKRRVYRLTRSGRRELGRRRDEWRLFAGAVEAVLA